jgi:hypothetical protein
LSKEVLFQADLEVLIGKRPFEIKNEVNVLAENNTSEIKTDSTTTDNAAPLESINVDPLSTNS